MPRDLRWSRRASTRHGTVGWGFTIVSSATDPVIIFCLASSNTLCISAVKIGLESWVTITWSCVQPIGLSTNGITSTYSFNMVSIVSRIEMKSKLE